MEMIDFEWLRCSPGGWQIVPRRKPARKPPAWTEGPGVITLPRWTVEGAPDASLATAGKRQFEPYRPTEFPALFQRFADMPATAEGMRDFYDTFGPLEFGSNGDRASAGLNFIATDLGGVLAHHAALRRAIALFDTGDTSSLAQRYNAGWGQLRTELRPQPSGKIALVFVPFSLIHFLWLQFALHTEHTGFGVKLFRCERCGVPFRVGTGTRRRDTAKFCSNACKVAAFRQRHGEAHA
jgi:hypothetical protein